MTAGHDHRVQFFGANERGLVGKVAAFLAEGLERGDAALIVAEPCRAAAIRRETEERVGDKQASERLVVHDARELLDAFLVDGEPDPERFAASVGATVRTLAQATGRVRAYGEMVGVLWTAGRTAAAVTLEGMWSALLADEPLDLYCGYPIDVLGSEFQLAAVEPLIAKHATVVEALDGEYTSAVERALDEVLGPPLNGLGLRGFMLRTKLEPELPTVERTMLALRREFPRYADEVAGPSATAPT